MSVNPSDFLIQKDLNFLYNRLMKGKFKEKPLNEKERLVFLESLEILDTANEEQFDEFVAIAAHIAQTPIALVSLIDSDRQWFKAKIGLDVCQTPRDISFCTHVVYRGSPLIIEDATIHDFFKDNPLVKDGVVGAYAGFPLLSKAGYIIGTLCLIDSKPRPFAEETLEILEKLSHALCDIIELRHSDKLRQLNHSVINSAVKNAIFKLDTNFDLLEDSLKNKQHIKAMHEVGRSLSQSLEKGNFNQDQSFSRQEASTINIEEVLRSSFEAYESFLETNNVTITFKQSKSNDERLCIQEDAKYIELFFDKLFMVLIGMVTNNHVEVSLRHDNKECHIQLVLAQPQLDLRAVQLETLRKEFSPLRLEFSYNKDRINISLKGLKTALGSADE